MDDMNRGGYWFQCINNKAARPTVFTLALGLKVD